MFCVLKSKVVEYFRKIGNFKQMKLNYRNENYKKLKVAEIRSQIFFMEIWKIKVPEFEQPSEIVFKELNYIRETCSKINIESGEKVEKLQGKYFR